MTPLLQKVLCFIYTFEEKHGYYPTYREIQDGLNYKAVSNVFNMVQELISIGHLEKNNGQRSISITIQGLKYCQKYCCEGETCS